MIKVDHPWTPEGGPHGELDFPNGSDPQVVIDKAIRKLRLAGFSEIKYCIITRQDSSRALFFELI